MFPPSMRALLAALLAALFVLVATSPAGAAAYTSQNGYPVESASSPDLYRWVIPGTPVRLKLRRGPAGFLLAQTALWFDRDIEDLGSGVDDYGYAYRRIAGSSLWSNHSSGTAIDLNFYRHPRGSYYGFTTNQRAAIHERERLMGYALRWGGDWSYTDPMHFEISAGPAKVRRIVRWLKTTDRGRQIIHANPNR